jgi:hypothetical protein
VAVRLRNREDLGGLLVPDFVGLAQEAIDEKRDL